MFKHLNVQASAEVHDLEPHALRHAATACGLCGSSSAGCTVNSVTTRGKVKVLVLCYSAPMCNKTPSLTPSKKEGKLKNVPVKCDATSGYGFLRCARTARCNTRTMSCRLRCPQLPSRRSRRPTASS